MVSTSTGLTHDAQKLMEVKGHPSSNLNLHYHSPFPSQNYLHPCFPQFSIITSKSSITLVNRISDSQQRDNYNQKKKLIFYSLVQRHKEDTHIT